VKEEEAGEEEEVVVVVVVEPWSCNGCWVGGWGGHTW
jgi:hypothetical protein